MAESVEQSKKLSEVYNQTWEIYEFLERCDEPSSSAKAQSKVSKGIEEGERAVQMINTLNLFSDNESIDEVATNEIRYLLMPALLAYFTSMSTKEERLDLVKKAQVYHVDYLRLIKLYGIQDVSVPKLTPPAEEEAPESQPQRPGMPDIASMQRQRDAKIARYKEQKANEQKLAELSKVVQSDHVDEELKRNYYLTLLKSFVCKTQDALDSIEMELPVLEHMAKMKAKAQNGEAQPLKMQPEKSEKAFQPFILTKDKLQAAVFGAGYPSIPSLTVEEWCQREMAAGRMPDQGPGMQTQHVTGDASGETPLTEQEETAKEEQQERDDPEVLKKARNWDDWKDDHRRGWGNRQNRL